MFLQPYYLISIARNIGLVKVFLFRQNYYWFRWCGEYWWPKFNLWKTDHHNLDIYWNPKMITKLALAYANSVYKLQCIPRYKAKQRREAFLNKILSSQVPSISILVWQYILLNTVRNGRLGNISFLRCIGATWQGQGPGKLRLYQIQEIQWSPVCWIFIRRRFFIFFWKL